MDVMEHAVISEFTAPSEFTDLASIKLDIKQVPNDVEGICQFVQGNLIHAYWLEHYGVEIDISIQRTEMQTRYAKDLLSLAMSKSGQAAHTIKAPNHRVVSICRDFSLLVCSIFRMKGVPARIRSGFAAYLGPDHFEDHWVCEYWNGQGWVSIDAQLDGVHQRILKFEFDPCDVPSSQFLVAGQAWKLARENSVPADKFGFADFKGLAFIKASLIRDLFALSKYEMHTWDIGWGILPHFMAPVSNDDELHLLDELAKVSCSGDAKQAHKLVDSCEAIRLPGDWNTTKFPTLSELYASL